MEKDIGPGQSQSFIYFGNLVPNEIIVRNTAPVETQFRLTSDPPGWTYWGQAAGQGRLLVEFPSGKLTFHNNGSSTIRIIGQDLRPI